jgi:hypothetical protein
MQELPARLEQLLNQADALLIGLQRSASARQQWHQQWLQSALQNWLQTRADLAAPAQAALQLVPVLLAQTLSAAARPWLQQALPVRQLIELAASSLRGFDGFSGRRSEALPQQIGELLREAQQGSDAVEACQQLGERLRQHATDVRPLEQQLINKERQQRQQLDAARGATRVLQQRLAAVSLPDFALPFFDGELRKLLQIVHLQHGESSTHWTQLLSDLDTLIWALTETDISALRNGYGSRISSSQSQLREQFASLHHNADALDDFFNALDFYLLSLLNGQQPAVQVQPWPESQDLAQAWSQTGDALLKARALRVGDWLEMQLQAGIVRARLLDKDLNQGIYLFGNLSGLRVARLTTAELTEQFTSQKIRIVDARPLLIAALPTLIEELENQLLQLQLDSQHLVEQQRQQEAARLQRELERKRAEQAAAAAREEAAREVQARAEAQARLLLDCQQTCRRLQAGAWLELRHVDGDITAQLAVILNRTGELLWVDRQGRKVLQVSPDALAEQVSRGEARILDHGRALDDALQQMVADQRQKKDQWLG